MRLQPARRQVGEVNQQSKGQGEIKQSINPESHILKSMGTLPVQFPNPHKECGTEEKQITFFITEIVMNEPWNEKQAPAEDTHGTVDPDMNHLCHMAEFK